MRNPGREDIQKRWLDPHLDGLLQFAAEAGAEAGLLDLSETAFREVLWGKLSHIAPPAQAPSQNPLLNAPGRELTTRTEGRIGWTRNIVSGITLGLLVGMVVHAGTARPIESCLAGTTVALWTILNVDTCRLLIRRLRGMRRNKALQHYAEVQAYAHYRESILADAHSYLMAVYQHERHRAIAAQRPAMTTASPTRPQSELTVSAQSA